VSTSQIAVKESTVIILATVIILCEACPEGSSGRLGFVSKPVVFDGMTHAT